MYSAIGRTISNSVGRRLKLSAACTAKVDQRHLSMTTRVSGRVRNNRICSRHPLRKNIAEAHHSASRIIRTLSDSANQASSVPRHQGTPSFRESAQLSVVLPVLLRPSDRKAADSTGQTLLRHWQPASNAQTYYNIIQPMLLAGDGKHSWS